MKYIVMECHPAYAVLMNEASQFVKAANLHYEVGQTVTDPILMETEEPSRSRIRMIVKAAAAAAACLVIAGGAGYLYYAQNLKTRTVVMISSEAQFQMGLNQKGEVVYLKSQNDSGAEILADYDGKGKDKLTVANELLEIEKSKGYLTDGDSFDLYISAEDAENFDSLKTSLEQEISELNLKVNVQTMEKYNKPVGPVQETDQPQPPENSTPELANQPTPPHPIAPPDEKEPVQPPAPIEEKQPPKPAESGKQPKKDTPPAVIPPTIQDHTQKPVPPAEPVEPPKHEPPIQPTEPTEPNEPAEPHEPPALAERILKAPPIAEKPLPEKMILTEILPPALPKDAETEPILPELPKLEQHENDENPEISPAEESSGEKF